MKRSISNRCQEEFTFSVPEFFVPAVQTRQPDGSVIVRAGKPVAMGDDISTAEAAQILGLSQRCIEQQCTEGMFRTAHKPGAKVRSRWRISRAEVWSRKHPQED